MIAKKAYKFILRTLPVSLLLFVQVSFGQALAPSMHFDYLTIYEGLSHNTVFDILQDKHGYIWMATSNGLNKYDGYKLEIYRSNGQSIGNNGFVGKIISSLFEDSSGNLWVGTNKQGVNILKKGTDQFLNLQFLEAFDPIRGADISSLTEDDEGNIWMTTVGSGVLKYNPEKRTSKHYSAENSDLSNDTAFDIIQDKYGTIWVATRDVGLNYLANNDRFQLSNVEEVNHPNMNGYRKKLFLDDEFLWIATEGTGLYRLELKSRKYFHIDIGDSIYDLNSVVVRDIQKTDNGLLFIATDGGGLNVYDESTGEISKYTYSINNYKGLNSNALFCFLKDKTGNIWIGSYDGGVNIYKPHKTWFEVFPKNREELQYRSILSAFQSRDGKIWIGTDGGGLNGLKKNNNVYSLFTDDEINEMDIPLIGKVVKTIFEDSKGELWFGTYSLGLDRYNPITKEHKHYEKEYTNPLSATISGNNIWSIAERKDGKVWISPLGEGLNIFDKETEKFSVLQHNSADPNSLAENSVMVLLVDHDDQIWAGTLNEGLDFWDEENQRFLHYRQNVEDPHSISNNEIRAIFQDSRGDIWIGTEGGGLNKWMGEGRFEHITEKHGLIANSVMGITEDDEGMLWVTTFKGISRINTETGEVRNFDFHNRENSNQFNSMAILKTADGTLFFGGINGLNTIHPSQIYNPGSKVDLIFTDFKVLNKSIPVGLLPDGRTILEEPIEDAEAVHLNYLDNSFSFDFTAIDYTYPLEQVFAYKMEGFDTDWLYTSPGQPNVSYTNLDHGEFTFKIRCQENEASIKVIITPPFWETIWFKCLSAFLLISIVSIGFVFILKRKEQAYKQELLEAQSEILQLRNKNLRTEVGNKNSKLMFSAVQMAHKNEILGKIKEDLKNLDKQPKTEFRQLMRMLDQELKSEDYWKEFNLYFDQVDQDFIKGILKRHPKLTQNDLRICALLRINLSTKEIASLLNVSPRGVEQSRYRLKKRLGLSNEDDLLKYITNFRN